MKVYRFKCKDCGATRYEKLDDVRYMCEYCGYVEEVHREEPKEEKTDTHEFEKEPIINYDEIRNEAHVNPQMTHYIILLIVCFFGGTLGIHRFLERKFLSGFVYFVTVGLFGIGVFFDMIAIVLKLIRLRGEETHSGYDSGRMGDRDND